MKLYILVGLPGSGRHEYAKKLPGFVHSVDEYKQKHPDVSYKEAFQKMFESTQLALKTKSDVVFIDTNLTRNKRRKLIKLAKEYDADTIAVLFLTPIDICKQNCNNEETVKKIERLAASFEIPTPQEFAQIRIQQEEIADDSVDFNFTKSDGNNALSVIIHLQLTERYLESKNQNLKEAALYHDIGKALIDDIPTRRYKTKTSYTGHENYGAYWYLTTREVNQDVLETAALINYHMRPFVWERNPNMKKKDSKSLGETLIKKLEILHKANIKAKEVD